MTTSYTQMKARLRQERENHPHELFLRDACPIMGEVVQRVGEIMMDNNRRHWGKACYLVAGK